MKRVWKIVKVVAYISCWIGAACLVKCGIEKAMDNGWHEECGKSQTSPIYSLHNQTSVSGSFILGVGSVSGYDCYVFYKRTSSGGFLRESIPVSSCLLYEGNYKPTLTEYGCLWSHLVDSKICSQHFTRNDYQSYYHKIYVPTGTITEQLTDLK